MKEMYKVFFLMENGDKIVVAYDQTHDRAKEIVSNQIETNRYIIEEDVKICTPQK